MNTIWNLVLKSLLKRALVGGSDTVDMTVEKDGFKIHITASNVKIKVEQNK